MCGALFAIGRPTKNCKDGDRLMEKVKIEFEPFIDDEVRRFIVDGVDYYNIAATRMSGWFPVNFALRGEAGDVLGGVLAWYWGGWLQISYLWVAEVVSGEGHGTRLMQAAEDYARSRGAIGATVETHSFQARPFYERLGYEVFAMLEDYPLGHEKYFLRKALVAEAVAEAQPADTSGAEHPESATHRTESLRSRGRLGLELPISRTR